MHLNPERRRGGSWAWGRPGGALVAKMCSTCLRSHTRVPVVGHRRSDVPGKRQPMVKSDEGGGRRGCRGRAPKAEV